jgi:hypothetical protein
MGPKKGGLTFFHQAYIHQFQPPKVSPPRPQDQAFGVFPRDGIRQSLGTAKERQIPAVAATR